MSDTDSQTEVDEPEPVVEPEPAKVRSKPPFRVTASLLRQIFVGAFALALLLALIPPIAQNYYEVWRFTAQDGRLKQFEGRLVEF